MYHLLEEIVVSEEIVSSILIFRIKNTSPFLTYYYYYSIPEFILPSPLWKQSPNRKSEETGTDNRPTVDETGASGTLELGNGRDKFGIGDSKRD